MKSSRRPHSRKTPPDPAIRAFPAFEEVPPGHAVFRVGDDRHLPFLRAAEWVVIDTHDRTAAFGELFVILQSNGPILWQIVRWTSGKMTGDDRPMAMLCPLAHEAPDRRGAGRVPMPFNLSDGPIAVADIERDILGRVVAIIDPDRRHERKWREAIHARVERDRAAKNAEGSSPHPGNGGAA